MSDLQENKITNISDAEAASPTVVFGFGKKTRNREPRKTSKPPKLTTEDLRHDAKLLDLFHAMTRLKNPVLKNCEADLLNVFCAAERALEHGDDPPALFVHIVRDRQWQLITNEQEDRARQRLRRLRNPEREAERRRRHDYDVPTGEISEPHFVGDIFRELINKLSQPTIPNPSETIHA